MEFETYPYTFSHGKEPKGRGSWAFGTKPSPDASNPDECFFSPGGMTYAEAKKWAKAYVEARFGATKGTLYVQP